MKPPNKSRALPVAPPVYRPQPRPKVLQTKMAVRSASPAGQTLTSLVVSRVQRPQSAPNAAQPKMPIGTVNRKPPAAAPVNRPELKRIAQPKMPLTGTPMESKFPPVYRPPAKRQPVQMKAKTVAQPGSRSQIVQKKAKGVVQMTPCDRHHVENCQLCGGMLGLLSGTIPFNQSLTQQIFSYLGDEDLAQVSGVSSQSHEFASMELARRRRLRVMRLEGNKPFQVGVFTGTHECTLHRNCADLHVQGELGPSIDNSHLVRILKWLFKRMKVWHEETGVAGFLEWHPTGAVVTKQVVELLAVSLCGGLKLAKPFLLQKKRKFFEDKRKRNKLASIIQDDILPEFFAFLDCLRGVKGIQIIGVFMLQPPSYSLLASSQDKYRAKEQNMLEESDAGTERFSHFIKTYAQGNVPSLKVIVDYRLIPQLIQAILSHGK